MAEWFAPKRYGYGAGWPVAWQGWAVLSAFAIVIGLSVFFFGRDDLAALSIVMPSIFALLVIIARTTRGGWRWRWGSDD
jgi:hypothetical protein